MHSPPATGIPVAHTELYMGIAVLQRAEELYKHTPRDTGIRVEHTVIRDVQYKDGAHR